MKLFLKLILLLFSLVLFSCNQSKPVSTKTDNQSPYFIIGSGGGFTGLYTQYKINSNGLIEKYDFEHKTYEVYQAVKRSHIKSFFTKIETLALKDYLYNKPGNITDYLVILSDNQKTNRIAWDNGSSELNPEIIAFYEDVNRFIKSLK